jgi:hypothetical protein
VRGFEKHEDYLNRKRYNFEINGILWKIKNRNYVAWLKNAVDFLFA